jgi:hypothetical protein
MRGTSRAYSYNENSAIAIANVTFPRFCFVTIRLKSSDAVLAAIIAAGSATATAPVAVITVSDRFSLFFDDTLLRSFAEKNSIFNLLSRA